MPTGPLASAVTRFVDEVSEELGELAGQSPETLRREVAVDASDLVAALLDSDGRFTDDELWAYLQAFADELDGLAGTSARQLRTDDVLAGKSSWLTKPSTLFDLLVAGDVKHGTDRSWHYYRRAMPLAHATAAIDTVPSADELAAIDRLRTTLLGARSAAGLPRPGAPSATGSGPGGAAGPAVPPAGPGAPVTPSAPGGPVTPSAPGSSGTSGPPAAPPVGEAAAATAGAPAPVPELPPARPIEELLAELDALIGLTEVKAEVRTVADLVQVQKLRAARKLPVVETSRHLVFTGNPGTGKTTVARLLSQIFRTLGVVERGHLVETDRSQLVAGYVGQTATKTRAAIEQALGGMLLIDEAYALARGNENDFGREAIDTLVKMMEDHRHDLVVVIAGYTDEMETLVEANPGMRSRFTKTIHFPDYSDDELVAIFRSMGDKQRYVPDESAVAALRELLGAQARDRGFGNARFVRNVFEAAIARQARRMVAITEPTDDQLCTLTAEDVRAP